MPDCIDITIMMTCYNERDLVVASIETVVSALEQSTLTWELIVVDDVSSDDSVVQIQGYIDAHPDRPVRLHRNAVNRGLANNFVDGAFMGKGHYYRMCCGDNSEPVECLTRMLEQVGKADLVVPYQNRIPGRSMMREVLSKSFTFLVNTLGGFKLKYFNGSPVYKRFHVLRYPPVTFGFGFQADLITRLLDGGASYVEVPRDGIEEQKGGGSTAVSMRNLLSVVHTFAEIIFRRVRRLLYPKTPKLLETI